MLMLMLMNKSADNAISIQIARRVSEGLYFIFIVILLAQTLL